jgi:hypothetical protein
MKLKKLRLPLAYDVDTIAAVNGVSRCGGVGGSGIVDPISDPGDCP